MTANQSRNRSDVIAFDRLVALLRQGTIAPGTKLYEPELSELLNLGRTPLRAALGRLLSEGVLTRAEGKKGYVLPPLTPEDREHLFEARHAVECAAAALAAKRRTPEQLKELKYINWDERCLYELPDQARKEKDRETYARLNEQFHTGLVAISGNEYLSRFFHQVYWRASLYPLIFAPYYSATAEELKQVAEISWKEHADLIDAIEKQDSDAARELMSNHLHATFHQRAGQRK